MNIRTLTLASFGLLALSVFILLGCRKDNPATDNPTGDATEVGTPNGSAVTGSIGQSGGTLTAENGKVELIIPAGALSGETQISIQPLTSTIPLGLGKAFRLKPDNLQFNTPVKLVYHYSTDELAGTAPEAIFAAHQGTGHIWQAHNVVVLDTVSKTISADLYHFSDWGFLTAYRMEVSAEIVDPGEQIDLQIKQIPGASVLFTLGERDTAGIGNPVEPAGGANFEIDRARPFPAGNGQIETINGKTTYTAPLEFPPDSVYNLVRVSARINLSPNHPLKSGNQVYQMTWDISLGGTVEVTVNGRTFFFNGLYSGVMAFDNFGQSQLAAHSIPDFGYSLNLRWDGTGVGNFISSGTYGDDFFFIITPDMVYRNTYFIPCQTGVKYLSTSVDISSLNKTRKVIRGTFAGTLCMLNVQGCNCPGIPEPIECERETTVSGFFRVRWSGI